MSASMFMYADVETISSLNNNIPKIILFGGYLGYNNFGDILQLKGAIKYHTEFTRLEPVVVCQVGSIADSDYLSRLRKWFDVRSFIFVQDHPIDFEVVDLCLIDSSFPIDHLHVYGGGFLNRMWGDYCLRTIEGLIDNFRVRNYIISGQQIDSAIANTLKTHFDKYKPKLVATRDFESQKIVNSIGYSCDYSFDDASNVIELWAKRKPEVSACSDGKALFMHLNTSQYAWNTSKEYRDELAQIVEVLRMLHSRYATYRPVFINAYSEYRVEVKDTISTLINLETAIPFLYYGVIDIAHMALLHNPFDTAIDKHLGVFGQGIAVSSSYHTALFCNMLNIPCYLLSENVYYKQKRDGVGESRSLNQFLENPSILPYSSLSERRIDWLYKMTSFFENQNCNLRKDRIRINYNATSHVRTSFDFKKASAYQNCLEDLKRRVSDLEAELEMKSSEIIGLEKVIGNSNRELRVHKSKLNWSFVSLMKKIHDYFDK